MTKIDRALKTLSELYEFNKKIKKYRFSEQASLVREDTKIFPIKKTTPKQPGTPDCSENRKN